MKDEILLMCAFRYALKRNTYVVSTVAEELIQRRGELSDSFKKRTIEEIEEEENSPYGMGADCYKEYWMKVKAALNPENEVKVRAWVHKNTGEAVSERYSSEIRTAIKCDGKYYSTDSNMLKWFHDCEELN